MGDDITIGVTEIVNNIEVTAQPNDQIVDINVTDNSENVTLNITPTVIEINVNKGSSYARWGSILGTLTDQTDLANALILKADLIDGLVPSYQLPSYVDDVIEVANYAALPASGETGKIYITLDTNHIYRWSGSTYIEITDNTAVWGAITGTLSSQTDLVNALNLRVPYTGATSNVNLGEYGLTGGFLALDTTPTSTPTGIGTIYWDSANRTAALIDGDGDTTLQIGQEQRILVHNNTGSTLTDGQVVYVTGSTGNLPSVSLANASSETTSAATLGVVTESIANGADGFITTSGIVNGLNTLAFNEGDLLWLGTTAGTFTTTKPISPNHLVLIGYVIKKAGGNGSILVKIQNTQELKESSDVLFTSLTNNDILTYESSTDLWKNKSIATILGYTPANDSSVVHLAGTETISGIKTFSNATKFDFGTYLKQDTTTSYYTGYTTIDGFANGFTINNGDTRAAIFTLANNASRNYTFPDANGTFALTSDLSVYALDNTVVHLAGTETISGNKTFTGSSTVFDYTGASRLIFKESGTEVGDFSFSPYFTQFTSKASGGYIFKNSLNNNSLTISNSGNGAFLGSLTATSIIKSGGTSSQYLMADGSVSTLTNPVTASSATANYHAKFTGSGYAIGNSIVYDNGTNVGIGTTSPNRKLEVNTTSNGIPLRLQTDGSNTGIEFLGGSGVHNFFIGKQYNVGNAFEITPSTTVGGTTFSTPAFIVNSSGNVGIGITSPVSALTVGGSSGAVTTPTAITMDGTYRTGALSFDSLKFYLYKSSTESYGLGLGPQGDVSYWAGTTSTGMHLFYTSQTERMRITSGGTALFGRTTSFSSGYSIGFRDAMFGAVTTNGNNLINFFNASDSYVASIVVNASTIVYGIGSDYRLKEDLKDFNGLEKVSKIKVYDFKFIEEGDRMEGVLAHELQEIVPYAVTGEKDGLDSEGNIKIQNVDYSKLVPILVKAIQEQQEQIELLKQEIEILKNK